MGTVLEADNSTLKVGDPRFCVAIDPAKGFALKLAVVNITGYFSKILVEYEVASNGCAYCESWSHSEDDCSEKGLL